MTNSADPESIAELVTQLDQTAAELRSRAAEEEFPAIERNAKRLETVVWVLRQHVPPELVDADSDSYPPD